MKYTNIQVQYETTDEAELKVTQEYMSKRTLYARLDKVLRCFIYGMNAPALTSQTPTVYELYSDQTVIAIGKHTSAGYITDGSITTACLVELGMNSHVLLHDLLTMTMPDEDGKPIALVMQQDGILYAPFFAVLNMADNSLQDYTKMEAAYRAFKSTKRKHKRNRGARTTTKH